DHHEVVALVVTPAGGDTPLVLRVPPKVKRCAEAARWRDESPTPGHYLLPDIEPFPGHLW
ncbi:MAG: hypothetical protein GYB66_10465, partial [Chloroflexi bacterium]|nr:hypothetical protein [Chloroflexota bacterium]